MTIPSVPKALLAGVKGRISFGCSCGASSGQKLRKSPFSRNVPCHYFDAIALLETPPDAATMLANGILAVLMGYKTDRTSLPRISGMRAQRPRDQP